jgi:hypothetical protein
MPLLLQLLKVLPAGTDDVAYIGIMLLDVVMCVHDAVEFSVKGTVHYAVLMVVFNVLHAVAFGVEGGLVC